MPYVARGPCHCCIASNLDLVKLIARAGLTALRYYQSNEKLHVNWTLVTTLSTASRSTSAVIGRITVRLRIETHSQGGPKK